MNALNILAKFYGLQRNYGLPIWVMTPLRRATRSFANWYLPKYLSKPVVRKGLSGEKMIVSFTSFPARIMDVWKVVESLKRQSLLPEKIILWLSKEQFPTEDTIPDSLWKQVDNLFEIRMVEGDIRSHKKYYYVMQEFPNYTFITCDDDIYYDADMIKRLVVVARNYPKCIIANVTSRILFDDEGNVLPYLRWDSRPSPFASADRVQIGIGGVLYPPNCLHKLTLRKDLFLRLAPLADDIWLNTMARLNNTPVVQSSYSPLPLPIENASPSLSSVNNGAENKNDVQIKQIRDYLQTKGLVDVYSNKCHVESAWGGNYFSHIVSG
jgi:hypothetical protein